MVRVFFPNMFMRLVSINKNAQPHPMAKLIVQPKMTKTEVKEYLTKIYNIPVLFVHTANFLGTWSLNIARNTHLFLFLLGKWKSLVKNGKIHTYKRRNYKVAYVFYSETPFDKTNRPPTISNNPANPRVFKLK